MKTPPHAAETSRGDSAGTLANAPREGALPNLVVVGAMKCGTSSLHYYLDLHPAISMSSPKELDFFLTRSGGNWHRGIDWYASHFDPSAQVRGESSPNYSDPLDPEVSTRMAGVVPGARLVMLVRHPVERMISHYRHAVSSGSETGGVAEALCRPENGYVLRSRYATTVRQHLGSFPREHLLLLRDEDLLHRRRETMARVFRFVGVDDSFWSDRMERLRHRSAGRGKLRATAERLGLHHFAARLGLGGEAKWWMEKMVSRQSKSPAPAMPPELRRELLSELEPETAGLEKLTGWDLASWRV